jgi:iron complex outermembrane recepter protein
MPFRMSLIGTAIGTGLLVSGLQTLAFAQTETVTTTEATPNSELTEITVTAAKVSSSLQQTPIAVTVVDGNTLTNQGIVDMRGVQNLVPSANFQEERGATKVFLRGVGTFLDVDSSDPAVATNMDEVYTPREATGGSLYDVKDVEVLSGPQGTLYGRNAAGGAVNVATNDPTHTLGVSGFLEGGNYGLAHASAVLNLPRSDLFAIRAAVDYQRHDGYLSNGMNDQKAIGARIKALFTPTDYISILVAAEYYHDGGNGDTPVYVVPSPQFPSTQSPWTQNIDPGEANFFRHFHYTKYYAKAQFDLGDGVTLVYIPAFVGYNDDANFLNGPGALEIHPAQDQYSQELRLQQKSERIDWVVGGYWYKSDGDTFSLLTLPPIPIPYPQTTTDLTVHSKSYAGFGQGTVSVTDDLRLIAGLRYSKDNRSGDGTNAFLPAPGVSFGAPFTADLSSSHVDYRAGVQYDVAPQHMLYATFSTGYTQGGFVPLSSATVAGYTFEPEKLKSYAIGSKNRFWNNRFELNDEIYYYDLRNYQISGFSQALGGLIIVNANKAQMYGNDLTLRFNATEVDRLSATLGLERARAIDFVISDALVGASGACNCNGYTLPVSPAATASLDYEHTFTLPGGSTLAADVNTYYSASYWDVYNHALQTSVPAYTKTNVSITYHSRDDRWYVSLWGRNLENHAHYGSISNPASQETPTTGFIDPPITFGGRVGFKFQ